MKGTWKRNGISDSDSYNGGLYTKKKEKTRKTGA
jgi:hypothetical protein